MTVISSRVKASVGPDSFDLLVERENDKVKLRPADMNQFEDQDIDPIEFKRSDMLFALGTNSGSGTNSQST